MNRKLKIYWIIWGILAFLVTTGTIVYQFSSWFISAPLTLSPNKRIDISVIRILPDALRLELVFTRKSWDEKRPELGEFRGGDTWKETGVLDFPEPGDPIKIMVHSANKEIVYKAMPASGKGETTIYRELVPFVDDGNPNHFQWPTNDNLRYPLKVGVTKLQISVVEVGKSITGENASLVINPPITFKFTRKNYHFFWWFLLWPFYTLLLAYLGLVLFRMSKRDIINRS